MYNFFSFSAGGSFWESLAEWYQSSTICEILTYLENTYFSINLNSYQNFSVSDSAGMTLRNIILGFAIGIIIAAGMIVHTRKGVGGFVRTLLRNDCTSPEKAKTLSELGYFQNPSIRRELKRRVTLSKLVRCKEEDEALGAASFTNETDENKDATEVPVKEAEDTTNEKAEEKTPFALDVSTMHFYIPEDLRYRAEIRFERRGSTWGFFAIVTALTVVAAALLCVFLPDLFWGADMLITFLSP